MGTKNDIDKMMKELDMAKKEVIDNFDEIGEEAVKLIKKRTRLGYGVKDHGDKKFKLDKLSDSYQKYRKSNKPKGPSTPKKSNLTYTGDMLDDLVSVDYGDRQSIEFKTSESEEKAEYVSKKRPFNHL